MALAVPNDLRYTKEHEWARVSGKTAVVGITAFAVDQLGDVVFVELPKQGATVEKGKPFGVVESTKAVSDLFSPVDGTVTKMNQALVDAPDQVNADPYAAWMIEIEVSDEKVFAELLSAAQYTELTKG